MSIANIKRYAMRNIKLNPMAQQTALEWFLANLPHRFKNALITACEEEIEEALRMEKEQIVDAHYQGYRSDIGTTEVSEQYYNETYKKQ